MVVHALRFEEDLMRRLVGKPNNLVFDRRAIARADPINMAAIHGGSIKIGADNLMRFFVGVRNPAIDLRGIDTLGKERKQHRIIVSGLPSKGPTDRAPVQPWRCAGFQTPQGQFKLSNRSAILTDGSSPMRPPGRETSPIWITPRRNVPVVRMTP